MDYRRKILFGIQKLDEEQAINDVREKYQTLRKQVLYIIFVWEQVAKGLQVTSYEVCKNYGQIDSVVNELQLSSQEVKGKGRNQHY